MIQQIGNLTPQWLDRLAHKDLEGILSLYAKDAALMPTLRNKIHKNPSEKREYFEFFLSFPNLHGEIITQYTRLYGEVAINTGFYKFIFLRNGEEAEILCRFSFTYKKEKEE